MKMRISFNKPLAVGVGVLLTILGIVCYSHLLKPSAQASKVTSLPIQYVKPVKLVEPIKIAEPIKPVMAPQKVTEILPADYAKCRRNFSLCKGKFIKFEGRDRTHRGNQVRGRSIKD